MRPRHVLLGVVVGSVLLVGACTSRTWDPAGSREQASAALEWQRVALGDGLSAVTLVTSGQQVIVGALAPSRPRPRLLAGPDARSLTDVPLTPRSPYAFEARWFQVATHGGRVEAIAGARGGAHGNHRWSTWSGDTDGVAELEQPFGIFGSYGAGDLAGIAYAGASPVVLGAWQSERTGMDIATWTRTGDRWDRQPSTGTALGSTPAELVSATAITSRGDGLLLAGSVTHLSPGSVRVAPAFWTSPGPTGPWTRTDLPHLGDAGPSVVHAGACAGERCLLTGVTKGKVSVWEVAPDSQTGLPGIPAVPVPENGTVLAPVSVGGDDVVVAPSDDGSAVLRRSGPAWSLLAGPTGTPTSAVTHANELWLVTTDDQGVGTVWRARVA